MSFSQAIGHKSCTFGTDGAVGCQRRVVGLPWELEGICSIGLYSDIVLKVLVQKFSIAVLFHCCGFYLPEIITVNYFSNAGKGQNL